MIEPSSAPWVRLSGRGRPNERKFAWRVSMTFLALGLCAIPTNAAIAFTSAEEFLRSYDRTFTADDIVAGVASVTSIDRMAGIITLSHDPVGSKDRSLTMQKMEMKLPVANPVWLHELHPGMQVEFKAARRRGAITIIWLEPAPPEGRREQSR